MPLISKNMKKPIAVWDPRQHKYIKSECNITVAVRNDNKKEILVMGVADTDIKRVKTQIAKYFSEESVMVKIDPVDKRKLFETYGMFVENMLNRLKNGQDRD